MSLHIEVFAPDTPPTLSVVWCHGLPSSSTRDPADPGYPGLARNCAQRGWASAAFDFRGSYASGGDFTLSGWIEDLRSVVATMRSRFNAPLAVVGSSLGGSTAILAAATDSGIDLVVALAAPAHFHDLEGDAGAMFMQQVRASNMMRTPGFPPDLHAWAAEFRDLAAVDAAGRVSRPALLVHGTADNVVDADQARSLQGAFAGPCTFTLLRGSGHQLRRDPAAIAVVFAWLAAHQR